MRESRELGGVYQRQSQGTDKGDTSSAGLPTRGAKGSADCDGDDAASVIGSSLSLQRVSWMGSDNWGNVTANGNNNASSLKYSDYELDPSLIHL